MAKITKAQARRLLNAIDSKAKRLWSDKRHSPGTGFFTTKDMIAIENIVARNLKRLG
jgi:hypothetical protein